MKYLILIIIIKEDMREQSQSVELENQDLFYSILEQQLSYKFNKVRAVYLIQIVQQEVQQLLTQQFLVNYSKQLKTLFFQFEVKHKNNKWKYFEQYQFIQFEEIMIEKNFRTTLKIPIPEDKTIRTNTKNAHLDFLELFLNQISQIKPIVNEKQFRLFIQNQLPLSQAKIKRYKQMVVLKHAGGRYTEGNLKKILNLLTGASLKLFTISSHGIFYTDMLKPAEIQEFIFFSPNFSSAYEINNSYYLITISSSHRKLTLEFQSFIQFLIFYCYLKKAMNENQQMSLQRFDSFAPIRQKCKAKYYIDGKNYFHDVYEALLKARNQVFITGWMLSPHFSLKRPDPDGQTTLEKVFAILAKRGVKIKIILFMEPKMALNIDSQFTEQLLTSINPNIKVIRHPAYLLVPFLWSHHEKLIIVDQRIGFMGGLDLGYGRMDDSQHLLTDQKQQLWPGVDYCNYRKTDILEPQNYKKSSIDRASCPRMPWHDIAVRIKGNSVIDLCRHFVQYWNYVEFQKGLNQKQLLTYAGCSQNIRQSIHILSIGHDLQKWLREGKDKIMKRIQRKQKPAQREDIKNQILQEQEDLEQQVAGQVSSRIDDQQQIFYQSHIKNQSKIEAYTKQIIDSYGFIQSNFRKAINFSQKLAVEHDKYAFSKVDGKQSHQILRSASIWSIGLQQNQEEKSIYNAYLSLIQNAKEFIYIENQFFISVQNKIGQTIAKRIRKAHEEKKKFKVIIMVPFLPGFEGEPQDPSSSVLRIQIHYIYRTLCRGKGSILELLKDIPYKDYIQIFSLRNHGVLHGIPVTQIIYVHSKLMIVDDQTVLMGSANINDRSLLGKRDSQLAIIIEDQQKIEIKIDQNTTKQVSKFAHKLRIQIFKQHFGLKQYQYQIENFMSEQMWERIRIVAKRNAEIYYQIFGCYPDNKIRSFKDIRNALSEANFKKYDKLKDKIIGHAVTFATTFLADENLKIKPGQLQYLVPMISFT